MIGPLSEGHDGAAVFRLSQPALRERVGGMPVPAVDEAARALPSAAEAPSPLISQFPVAERLLSEINVRCW